MFRRSQADEGEMHEVVIHSEEAGVDLRRPATAGLVLVGVGVELDFDGYLGANWLWQLAPVCASPIQLVHNSGSFMFLL